MKKSLIVLAVLLVSGMLFSTAMAAQESVALETVLASEYDADNDIFVVVGVAPEGDIDVYWGFHNSWTKLQENRDIDNRYSPAEFVDFAIGLPGTDMYGVAIGNKNGIGTSINAREFYDKPWFGDGSPVQVGTLVEVMAIDYDLDNDNFYVVGEGPGGDIDVWYGHHNSWTQLQPNRDIGNRYTPEQFVDFALGVPAGDMFGVAVGNKNGAGTSINAREFYDKPWFGDGNPQPIGDLVEVLSIDYDADNDDFVVVGVGPEGDIDVYYGHHNSWTQLQENRDIDNRYAAAEFEDFSIGLPTGKYGANYGVVIGNVADYKVAFRTYAPRGTSINAREFYSKPWFGDGRPVAIGE